MTDQIREKMDEHIAKKFDELEEWKTDTEQYRDIIGEIERLTKITNDDDKVKADESATVRNVGLEDEKLIFEEKKLVAEDRRERRKNICSLAGVILGAAVTIFAYAGTWKVNKEAQDQAENFERGGDAYTSKADKWKIKLPMKRLPM